MQSKAKTVAAYLAELPEDRRKSLQAIRKVILQNIDTRCEEGMQYGAIGYYVPHSVYPTGYHCDPKQPLPFAGLASQKHHMSFGMFCSYGNPAEERWFRAAWTKTGKKLDMGRCCVRFRKLDDVPLDVIAEAFRRVSAKDFIAHYESVIRKNVKSRKPAAAKARPKQMARKSANAAR